MALQYNTAVRTSRLTDISTGLGANFSIELRTGAPPANAAAASTGTLLATFTNCNWAAASAGAMALTGTPYSATAAATGTVAHFRMFNGATCIVQGIVVVTPGTVDMTVDNTSIVATQTVNLSGYTITEGNA